MNSTWQILWDHEVVNSANVKWHTPTARFPRVILGFPSGDTGFPAFWQCWREEVPQDAEEEKEVVN